MDAPNILSKIWFERRNVFSYDEGNPRNKKSQQNNLSVFLVHKWFTVSPEKHVSSSQSSNVQSISMCLGQELAKTNKAAEICCFISLPSVTPLLAFASLLFIVTLFKDEGSKSDLQMGTGVWDIIWQWYIPVKWLLTQTPEGNTHFLTQYQIHYISC